jgi:hypothetical protein
MSILDTTGQCRSKHVDCLIGPLLSRLAAGGGRAKISEYLWTELEEHFGLDPDRYEGGQNRQPSS